MTDEEIRVETISHLRGARMHIEAAMSIDSGTWGYEQITKARKSRDLINELVEILDT